MPVAWFLCPYRRGSGPGVIRYPAMDTFTAQIEADGGAWRETEVLGDRCIVKVRASLATLQQIAGTPGFRRLPKDRLDDSLASLTNAQRTAIRNELLDAGYSSAELNARFPGNLGSYTLRDVLTFLASRRRKVRYDAATDSIVLDGPVQNCTPVQDVDAAVGEV